MDKIFIEQIKQTYDTPAYIFDINILKKRIEYLKSKLPQNVKLCYAIKANTFILKEIEDVIDRYEVCSPGEYYICKENNINPSKILISGVYKTPEVIKEMIESNESLNCYTIESIEQFKIIKNISNNKNIDIMLRITSGNQFGINLEEAEEIIKNRSEYPNLNIKGIQYFSGTQKRSLKILGKELDYLDEVIINLKEKYEFEIEELEYGSGFPVYYFQNDEFDEDTFLTEFFEKMSNMKYKGKIIIELGRWVAASCGTYITKVVDKKINKGQNYAILDGGMNHLVYYGQSMAMKIPKCKVYPKKESYEQKWNLCGSLCTTNDILVKQFPAGDLQIGDILIFENTGAYCMTEGISLFLSRDLPYVFKITEDKKLQLVRENLPTYKLNN